MFPKIDKNILILLLGGSGSRFNSRIPKQYIQLKGHSHPLFIETLINFSRFIKIDEAILVGNPEFMTEREFLDPLENFKSNNPGILLHVTAGGNTRHQSFLKGAEIAGKNYHTGILLVHDANRPNIDSIFGREINQAIDKTSREKPCWIPVIPSTDSMCQTSQNAVQKYLERNQVQKVQTPQIIYLPSLIEALSLRKTENQKDYTDEGSFMLDMGHKVFSYPGSVANIKITYPEDMG